MTLTAHLLPRLLIFAFATSLACLLPAGASSALYAAAMIGIAIAIWHGAFDGVLAQGLLEPVLGKRWHMLFVPAYVALAGAMLLLWWWQPRIALIAFLLYSAWHFGTEANVRTVCAATGFTAIALGALPILAACRWHAGAVVPIFSEMVHIPHSYSFAASLTTMCGKLLWPVALVAVSGILLGFRGSPVASRLESLALVALELVLFRQCQPVVAFAVFFCLWHTPEHLLSSSQDSPGHFSAKVMWQNLRSGLIPWLAALLALAFFMTLGPANPTAYASEIFILLSALTVPHMALNELRRL